MSVIYINTGSSANSGNGDSLRTAFNKVNANLSYFDSVTLTTASDFITNLQTSISSVAYSIPTVVSSFTNDIGYVTSATVSATYINKYILQNITSISTSFSDFQNRISLI